MFSHIKKRDGRIVEFDSSKITSAIDRAGKATGEFGKREAKSLTLGVLDYIHQLRLDSTLKAEYKKLAMEFYRQGAVYANCPSAVPRAPRSIWWTALSSTRSVL